MPFRTDILGNIVTLSALLGQASRIQDPTTKYGGKRLFSQWMAGDFIATRHSAVGFGEVKV
jgi:hypothetical protein